MISVHDASFIALGEQVMSRHTIRTCEILMVVRVVKLVYIYLTRWIEDCFSMALLESGGPSGAIYWQLLVLPHRSWQTQTGILIIMEYGLV